MGVSELAQNEALRSLNSMMHNNLFPRMSISRGDDDVMSGIANGYNMMGTIMEGIRARNDRNRLQDLLKQQFGNGENGQQTQNGNGYTLSLGDTDKLNTFQNTIGNSLMSEQKPDYTYSLGDTDKLNSFRGIFGDSNATPVSNQAPQQDYSMQTFMRNAINKGMLPSNAMAAYSAYLAPIEQDIRDRNVREAMRDLARRDELTPEELTNIKAKISYNLGKDYHLEDQNKLTDLLSKQYSGILAPLGLAHDPADIKRHLNITIPANAWDQLAPTVGVNQGNISVGYGTNAGFSQTDEKWSNTPYAGGTIGTSGCAPTTMANFLQRYGVNATPADVAKFSSENGYAKGQGGTSWGMFTAAGDKFGVPVHQTGNWEDVVNALKAGKPVMAGHDPGKFTSDPVNGSGHWLMYDGITPDGKISVVDANSGKKSGTYSADEVRADWERNNPVAFIANNNTVPAQNSPQQPQTQNYSQQPSYFASAFKPRVVSGQGAIFNPVKLYDAVVQQAERQRQQYNADRNYYQTVFDNNRNYELNKERVELLKQQAAAKQKQEDLSKYQLYSYDELYKEGSPIATLNNLIASPLKEDATDEQKKQYGDSMLNAVNSFAQYNVQKYKDLIAKGYSEQDAQTILRNGITNAVGRSFMASQGGNSDAKKYMIEKAVSDIYYRTMGLVAQDKEALSKPSSTGSFKMLNDANYSSDKLNEIADKSKQNTDDKELNYMVKKAKLEDKLKQLINTKDEQGNLKYKGLYLEREGQNLKIKMGRGITRDKAEPLAKELRRLAEEYAKTITNDDVVKYKNEVEEMKRRNKQYQEMVNSQYLSDAEAHSNFNNSDDELLNDYLKHAETSYSW